ncbi:iron-containing alcohol dehydrogenase [Gemmata sp. JC673]|uniref:Iron-containing alcohol dehydrogenase n=1 Tax=Gemmata algarum TaxID=2975278 RepID=A0ABU5F696_9BACT|nr:iron-containing alcohol dehydrogenase [Gemmata algarum]MDY3561404.1 iron-containing alcohol dehydrogenase [Gemmata algarum]
MRTWSFSSAGALFFGRNAVQVHLRDACERLGAKRAFIVTDAVLVRAGILAQVTEPLAALGVAFESFDRVTPEPGVELVRECVAAARAAAPDVVIGLGGGSNMDTAKLVSMILAHGGDPLDYAGDCRVPGPVTPLVCVPTTAGTGSEVSAAAVFTDTANHIKVSCLSPFLRPAFAIVDPLLTVTCPPKVTADSGIDALTHAIEGFCAVHNDEFPLPSGEKTVYQGKNPMADLMAREAITLVGRFLRRAVRDGSDLEARDGMALAATLGGLAFSNAGVALVHAMEYPVGGAVHVSHGAGNGLLLPFVMRFNLHHRVEQTAVIGEWLGVRAGGHGTMEYAEAALREIEQLRADTGIPTRLRDIGVKEEMLPGFAAKAFAIKRLMRVNPRMPQSEDEILGIYRAAF